MKIYRGIGIYYLKQLLLENVNNFLLEPIVGKRQEPIALRLFLEMPNQQKSLWLSGPQCSGVHDKQELYAFFAN